jgi:hypothetical protein
MPQSVAAAVCEGCDKTGMTFWDSAPILLVRFGERAVLNKEGRYGDGRGEYEADPVVEGADARPMVRLVGRLAGLDARRLRFHRLR